jgi:sulfur relay (sulfurtransferase) DsrC/TusE family protein
MGRTPSKPKKKKKMVHVAYLNINTFKSDSADIYIRNLYINTLGKHAKNLKFVRFFFFFFDNLLTGSIKMTIKYLPSKFLTAISLGQIVPFYLIKILNFLI